MICTLVSTFDIHQNCVQVTNEQLSHVDRLLSEVTLCCQQSCSQCMPGPRSSGLCVAISSNCRRAPARMPNLCGWSRLEGGAHALVTRALPSLCDCTLLSQMIWPVSVWNYKLGIMRHNLVGLPLRAHGLPLRAHA